MPDITAEDFARLVTLYAPETISALAFSPDGSLLAVASGDKVHLFQVPLTIRQPAPASPTPVEQQNTI